MQILQQKQPIPIKSQILSHLPYIGSTILLISTIAITTLIGAAGGIAISSALNLGAAIYLKDRWVARGLATALTFSIIAISMIILFPPTLPFLLPLSLGLHSASLMYGLLQVSKKIAPTLARC